MDNSNTTSNQFFRIGKIVVTTLMMTKHQYYQELSRLYSLVVQNCRTEAQCDSLKTKTSLLELVVSNLLKVSVLLRA